jgi:hypothetical protein
MDRVNNTISHHIAAAAQPTDYLQIVIQTQRYSPQAEDKREHLNLTALPINGELF